MITNKKGVKVQEIEVYNTEIIYARVLGLISVGKLELEDVFKHELSPIPMSLFDNSGEMRSAKNKSQLKRALQIVSSKRQYSDVDAVVIDGSALLWTVSWPLKGTVEDLAKAVYFVKMSKTIKMSISQKSVLT